jgi:predicted amidohydrolase
MAASSRDIARCTYTPLGEDAVFTAGAEPTVVDVDGIGAVGLSVCFDGDHPEYARRCTTSVRAW